MSNRISYRWACPYCSTARLSRGRNDEKNVRDRARSAVQGHVFTSDGDGHGTQYTHPDDFEPANHIERVTAESPSATDG